jgi:hypothetical protein
MTTTITTTVTTTTVTSPVSSPKAKPAKSYELEQAIKFINTFTDAPKLDYKFALMFLKPLAITPETLHLTDAVNLIKIFKKNIHNRFGHTAWECPAAWSML